MSKTINKIIECNSTRYNLLIGEYKDAHYDTTMCYFVWIKNGRGGPSLSWPKGEAIYANYVLEKTSVNLSDLTGILSAIKHYYPDTIGDMAFFDERYMYKPKVNIFLLPDGTPFNGGNNG